MELSPQIKKAAMLPVEETTKPFCDATRRLQPSGLLNPSHCPCIRALGKPLVAIMLLCRRKTAA